MPPNREDTMNLCYRGLTTATFIGALLAAATFQIAPVQTAGGSACESLAALALPNTTITAAQTVAAGAFTPPAANRGGGGGRRGAEGQPPPPGTCRGRRTRRRQRLSVRGPSGLLSRRRHADAQQRFRHQDRSVAALVWMERQIPGGRQRRLGRDASRIRRWPRRSPAAMRAPAPTPGTPATARRLRSATRRKWSTSAIAPSTR